MDDDCERWLEELSAYVDQPTSAAAREAIERHLAECADCRVVIETLSRTIRLYQTLPAPSFPAEARDRLYRSLSLTEFIPHPNDE